MIHFEIPEDPGSIIKIIGVGGGGSNAVTHMQSVGADGVDLIICNTDSQALTNSSVANKIQLGPHLTQGLGAGANPNIGERAAEESIEELKRILETNTKMAFITAGMGGGTGTGGAPIIAKLCKELDILTVAIVTTPFFFEGRKRMKYALEGIEKLKEYVDTIVIISNDKLRDQCGDLTYLEAFSKADDILATAAGCITNVINQHGHINTDFSDVNTVMREGGVAILGRATASGEDRARIATENALSSPLLNDNDIDGAKWILINITTSMEHAHTMDELSIIRDYIEDQAGDDANIILGMGQDETLGEDLSVTVIATGFGHDDDGGLDKLRKSKEDKNKVILNLEDKSEEMEDEVIEDGRADEDMLDDMDPQLNQADYSNEDAQASLFDLSSKTNSETEDDSKSQENGQGKILLNLDDEDNSSVIPVGKILYDIEDENEDSDELSTKKSIQERIEESMYGNTVTPDPETEVSTDDTGIPDSPKEEIYKKYNIPKIRGIRVLTEEERKELLEFEIQKENLENRANGLLMNEGVEEESFDPMDNSDDGYLSGFRVTKDDINNNKLISSINNFLHGPKPD